MTKPQHLSDAGECVTGSPGRPPVPPLERRISHAEGEEERNGGGEERMCESRLQRKEETKDMSQV